MNAEMHVEGGRWRQSVDSSERMLIIAIITAKLLFPAVLMVLGWPKPWRIFHGEESPINWFSSVQCAMLGALGLAVFFVSRWGRAMGSDDAPRSWPWMLLSLGFFFTSFDEKFEIHENVREVFLKPRNVMTDIRGLHPGDIVLPLYAVAGAILTIVLLAELRRHKPSLRLFVTAVILIIIVAFQDSLSLKVLQEGTVRHVQIIVEEIGEVWAQALFALSLTMLFFHRLRSLLGAARNSGVPETP